jgi:uncharacterized lipoprotein YddW (UPF0748 family)
MKKVILLLIICFSFTSDEILAKNICLSDNNESKTSTEKVSQEDNTTYYISKSEYRISVIDPTPKNNPFGAYYPGLRAGNQLVIYTPAYGERTGTNEFGTEAIVQNDIVSELTGSDSLIPANGYVISGHGNAKKWINKSITEGAIIKVNSEKNIIESTITPESYTYKARQKIENVSKILTECDQIKKSIQIKEAKKLLRQSAQKLDKANSYITKKQYDKAKDTAELACQLADNALYYLIPPKKDELHGIWLRPVEKTPQDVVNTLNRLQNSGINNIFLETYYQGYTIFPSKTLESYGVLAQRKEFQGWDPLKVWTEEAHKRGIKLHVWFQTYYTGNEDISKNPKHVISAHPDWANIQKRYYNAGKPMPSVSEHNGYFLDPANPEVQKYLSELIFEIANNYCIDGLNIDYIRYPASLPKKFPMYNDSTWGYSAYARKEFCQLYGIDPANITPDQPMWQNWVYYRQNKVTSFVANLKTLTAGKNIMISTVIFPKLEDTSVLKLQDWGVWGCNKYIDAVTPLIMGSDKTLVENNVNEIKNLANGNLLIFTGLFAPFTAGSPTDLLYQVESARKSGAAGVVIFDYAHLNDEFVKALKTGAFR